MIESKKILLTNKIVQCPGFIVSDMDEEKVMMSIQKGKYYNLGSVGGEIWDRVKSPISVGELIKALINEYEVDDRECQEQVLSYLELLYKEGLIKVGDE